ncbi:MAG TPA: DUF2752 domain-containing protein [Polyangiaceae bacterium]
MDRPRARRALVALGIVGAGVALAVTGAPACPTALFLGIPCPGCGLTRATLALLHGDFGAALRFHPLVFVLAPLFAVMLGVSLVDYVRGAPPAGPSLLTAHFSKRTRYGAAAALLVLAFGVWGARFAGYFGGPVPVESLRSVAARERAR